jgi:hypothetical protein
MTHLSTPPAGAPVARETFNPGFLTRNLYPVAEGFLKMPTLVDSFIKGQKVTADTHQNMPIWSKAYNAALEGLNWVAKKAVDYDYREFPLLGKMKISEPPIGALILLLYPFTVLPRMIRAAERDAREVGDVLRRDLTAITIFLFALKPIVNVLNKASESLDGLRLVAREGENAGKVFTYKQLETNYKIANGDTLLALIRSKNDKALQNATFFLSDGGLSKLENGGELQGLINQFKGKLSDLINVVNNNLPGEEKLAEETFQLLEKMDAHRVHFQEAALKGADSQLAKLGKKLPEFKNFFVRYAKARRLPVDILSFALVCVGIGWFPVWFNDYWNRKKFAEKMVAKQAENNAIPVDPSQLLRALKSSSRLSNQFSQFNQYNQAATDNPFQLAAFK